MSDNSAKLLRQLISPERMQDIEHWISKYPSDQRQSAVMAALRIVQEEHGFLTQELMDAIADYLDMPAVAVYEASTFYTMYEHKPAGRHLINVCTNISCQLCDSASVVKHLEKQLGVKLGETTSDGRFTLRAVECLGACVNAPMMQVNKDYHEQLTPEKIDVVLEQYQ
ncbi:NADH-quinone oxidoreductase subunit NuoE [Legionella oakridgensis]|uniref:NADH-quinone oxidoreductase subunit E n=2 Tax=Legionella oakridgensis TaxID=29423 RepID=W0BHW0_9GAMM|nr:NADH-quinone oxidoreductase subunit NuoE [Legionella oakridgensis]AHE68256.1 NADH-quinone oxidoreductase, E subunit [Legionella oakridgensis ATCC 33761 = DSM 21215]ETO92337.1 NADH dehydrogenase, subunit E [Legionella oakridgensis RV-2-2007]KTD39552.1 NADH dehydrogenase I chain E [Legionella oakridgensis]STY21212.1 NADH dehydrogenase I chain E [Legionella longbeachae]